MFSVVTLNRKQNDMKLFFFMVSNGEEKLILEERSDTWIDIHNFYERVMDMIYFPEKLKEFFWLSDRDGYQHLYRYDYEQDWKELILSPGEYTILQPRSHLWKELYTQ